MRTFNSIQPSLLSPSDPAMSAYDSGYSSSRAVDSASNSTAAGSIMNFDYDECDDLQKGRRRLRLLNQRSSSESMGGGLEFTAPPASGGTVIGSSLLLPSDREVMDVLKMSFMLQVRVRTLIICSLLTLDRRIQYWQPSSRAAPAIQIIPFRLQSAATHTAT